jgi:hypothetical protein
MDMRVQQPGDPGGSKAVKIVKVTDLRKFTADTRLDRSKPTVARSNEISDPAITVRTIGRAHGGSDIILPEDRTVEMLVGDAVQKALRGNGYSVASTAATSASEAIPVEVEIRKFWIWYEFGTWLATIYYEAEIGLKSPIVLNGSEETVTGHFEVSAPMVVSGMYTRTAESGIEDLIINTKSRIKERLNNDSLNIQKAPPLQQRLQELQISFEKGLISKEEYQLKRKEILEKY